MTDGDFPNGTGGSNGITFTVKSDPNSPSDTGTLTVATTGDAKGDFVIGTDTAPQLWLLVRLPVTVHFTRPPLALVRSNPAGDHFQGRHRWREPERHRHALHRNPSVSNADGSPVTATTGTCTPSDSTGGSDFGQVPVGVSIPNDIHNQEKVFVVGFVVRTDRRPLHQCPDCGRDNADSSRGFPVNTAIATCNTSALDVSTGMKQCLVYLDLYPQTTTGDKTGTLTITGSNGGWASVDVTGTATGPLTITPAPVKLRHGQRRQGGRDHDLDDNVDDQFRLSDDDYHLELRHHCPGPLCISQFVYIS